MATFALEALVAIVQRETAIINGEIAQFGQSQCNPCSPAFKELYDRYEQTKEQD